MTLVYYDSLCRLVELSGYKIHSTHSAATQLDSLSSISGNKIFRVEEIPHDQLRIESDELLIPVAHFHKVLPLFILPPLCIALDSVVFRCRKYISASAFPSTSKSER